MQKRQKKGENEAAKRPAECVLLCACVLSESAEASENQANEVSI